MSFYAPPRAKSWRQTLKFYSPVSPDPLNARSLRSGSQSHPPPLKNSRSANAILTVGCGQREQISDMDSGCIAISSAKVSSTRGNFENFQSLEQHTAFDWQGITSVSSVMTFTNG